MEHRARARARKVGRPTVQSLIERRRAHTKLALLCARFLHFSLARAHKERTTGAHTNTLGSARLGSARPAAAAAPLRAEAARATLAAPVTQSAALSLFSLCHSSSSSSSGAVPLARERLARAALLATHPFCCAQPTRLGPKSNAPRLFPAISIGPFSMQTAPAEQEREEEEEEQEGGWRPLAAREPASQPASWPASKWRLARALDSGEVIERAGSMNLVGGRAPVALLCGQPALQLANWPPPPLQQQLANWSERRRCRGARGARWSAGQLAARPGGAPQPPFGGGSEPSRAELSEAKPCEKLNRPREWSSRRTTHLGLRRRRRPLASESK